LQFNKISTESSSITSNITDSLNNNNNTNNKNILNTDPLRKTSLSSTSLLDSSEIMDPLLLHNSIDNSSSYRMKDETRNSSVHQDVSSPPLLSSSSSFLSSTLPEKTSLSSTTDTPITTHLESLTSSSDIMSNVDIPTTSSDTDISTSTSPLTDIPGKSIATPPIKPIAANVGTSLSSRMASLDPSKLGLGNMPIKLKVASANTESSCLSSIENNNTKHIEKSNKENNIIDTETIDVIKNNTGNVSDTLLGRPTVTKTSRRKPSKKAFTTMNKNEQANEKNSNKSLIKKEEIKSSPDVFSNLFKTSDEPVVINTTEKKANAIKSSSTKFDSLFDD